MFKFLNRNRTYYSSMHKNQLAILFILLINCLVAQDLKPFDVSENWLSKIYDLAPTEPTVKIEEKKSILVFSLHTGFKHWTIPHTEAVIKVLGKKSGAFHVVASNDISIFKKEELRKYDAIILNNNCSIDPRRNLFLDVLDFNSTLTDREKIDLAENLENNLLTYVKNGGGLVVLHGGITMLNKSMDFSNLVGGSFDYHPKQQKIKVHLSEKDHPLVGAFNGTGFEHIDEPYIFNNAYEDMDFRPLLFMKTEEIEGLPRDIEDNIKYISWIKRYGEGRVFYCSPSHNPQSYNNPELLQFILDGIQYAVGDFKCDDSPLKK